jgi:hypothetical protein
MRSDATRRSFRDWDSLRPMREHTARWSVAGPCNFEEFSRSSVTVTEALAISSLTPPKRAMEISETRSLANEEELRT